MQRNIGRTLSDSRRELAVSGEDDDIGRTLSDSGRELGLNLSDSANIGRNLRVRMLHGQRIRIVGRDLPFDICFLGRNPK